MRTAAAAQLLRPVFLLVLRENDESDQCVAARMEHSIAVNIRWCTMERC
jgi:hypothetical protein